MKLITPRRTHQVIVFATPLIVTPGSLDPDAVIWFNKVEAIPGTTFGASPEAALANKKLISDNIFTGTKKAGLWDILKEGNFGLFIGPTTLAGALVPIAGSITSTGFGALDHSFRTGLGPFVNNSKFFTSNIPPETFPLDNHSASAFVKDLVWTGVFQHLLSDSALNGHSTRILARDANNLFVRHRRAIDQWNNTNLTSPRTGMGGVSRSNPSSFRGYSFGVTREVSIAFEAGSVPLTPLRWGVSESGFQPLLTKMCAYHQSYGVPMGGLSNLEQLINNVLVDLI